MAAPDRPREPLRPARRSLSSAGRSSEEATAIDRLAAAAALDHWLKVWDKTHHLAAQADAGNLDRKQVLTTILLDMQRELQLAPLLNSSVFCSRLSSTRR